MFYIAMVLQVGFKYLVQIEIQWEQFLSILSSQLKFQYHFIFATAFGVCLGFFYIFAVPLIILGFITILVFKFSWKACLMAGSIMTNEA